MDDGNGIASLKSCIFHARPNQNSTVKPGHEIGIVMLDDVS